MDVEGEVARSLTVSWASFSSHRVTVMRGTELERGLISSRDCVRRGWRLPSLMFPRLAVFLWRINRGAAGPAKAGYMIVSNYKAHEGVLKNLNSPLLSSLSQQPRLLPNQ